jgi:hypothetical protein
MNNVIQFDKAKGQEGLAAIKEDETGTTDLARLSGAISSAMQSVKSIKLLQTGYCGSGLKKEIESANALEANLQTAGVLVQSMIVGPSR